VEFSAAVSLTGSFSESGHVNSVWHFASKVRGAGRAGGPRTHPELPCILDTDASDVAVGGVLSQVINGVERPIAFFTEVLGSTQKNYCTTRRELLAIILALQHFRHYLLGNKIILRTDHHSIKWLKTFKRPKASLPVR